MTQPTLLIGWDGAPFADISEWVDAGELPNLAAIASEGYFGPLETVPYVMSPCAWSTFLTGKNAGKHGVYDFYANDFREGQYFREPIDASARREPELWDLLNAQGLSAGMVNVPVTYPPDQFEEYMIAGVLAPGTDDPQFTHPPDLLDEFDTSEYLIDLDVSKSEATADFVDRLHEMVERRTDLLLHCIDNAPEVDVLMAVFTSPDRLAHYYWHFQDDSHPYRATESPEALDQYQHVVRDLFGTLDENLGRIRERFEQRHGEQANVAVLSDHGMDSLEELFFINQWLAENGYLTFDNPDAETDPEDLPDEKQYVFGRVDWEQTQAYSIGKAGEIYINLEGREPQGVVTQSDYERVRAEIAADLREAVDPRTDEGVVDSVTPREDLFDGPHVDIAPDLFVTMADGYYSLGYLFEDRVFMTNDRSDTPFVTAVEDRAGILCQSGPAFTTREDQVEIGLTDYVPTLLHGLGNAVPADADGRVVTDLLARSEQPSTFELAAADHSTADEDSDDVSDSVKQRLEDLGYR